MVNNKASKELNPEVMSGPLTPAGVGEMVGQGLPVQRIQTKYQTAMTVQIPRKFQDVQLAILEEAKFAGSDFFWGWHVKDKKRGKVWIEGGTIGLATSLAREWTNCAVECDLVEEKATHWVFKASFIDLQTGYTISKSYRQRRGQSLGAKYDKARAEDTIYQLGQSKAIRNAIFAAVPRWLVTKAIKAAKAAVKTGLGENLKSNVADALLWLGGKGATKEAVEASVGKASDKWTENDLLELRASMQALSEGNVSVEEIFPEPEERAPDKVEQPAVEQKEPIPKDEQKESLPGDKELSSGEELTPLNEDAPPDIVEEEKEEPPPPPPEKKKGGKKKTKDTEKVQFEFESFKADIVKYMEILGQAEVIKVISTVAGEERSDQWAQGPNFIPAENYQEVLAALEKEMH